MKPSIFTCAIIVAYSISVLGHCNAVRAEEPAVKVEGADEKAHDILETLRNKRLEDFKAVLDKMDKANFKAMSPLLLELSLIVKTLPNSSHETVKTGIVERYGYSSGVFLDIVMKMPDEWKACIPVSEDWLQAGACLKTVTKRDAR
ncbi:MAG: hypothetical protein ACOY15_04060 [Pseudomonadota bacterium]